MLDKIEYHIARNLADRHNYPFAQNIYISIFKSFSHFPIKLKDIGIYNEGNTITFMALVVLVSRAAGVFGILPVFNKAMRVNYIDFNYRSVLFWGGYRGAITIALSLSLPLELKYWFTIQSIAYGVVLFSLFFQAPTIKPLILQTTANESW